MVKLSLKDSKGAIPVAKIESKDTLNNEILFVDTSDSSADRIDSIQDIDFSSYFKTLKPRDALIKQNLLAQHVSKQLPPADDELAGVYTQVIKDSSRDFCLKTGSFIPIPNVNHDRTVWYLFAASGAGKTYLASSIIKQWMKLNSESVYVFSALDDDKVLDKLGNRIKRVNVDTLADPMDINELPDGCLVLYDDMDTITEKAVKENAFNLLNQILQIGRHKKISCIVTSHLATDFNRTRIILNEAHYICVYPSSGSFYQIQYLLKNYCGLSTEDIKKVKSLRTRWVCVYRHYPQYVLAEHECYLLSN